MKAFMNKVKLKYDPNLSIKENAAMCGVSESAVRKYIRVNHIDRRFDTKIAKTRHINRLKKENPNITLAELSRATGYSVNTIKKYLQIDLELSYIGTSKVSTFDFTKPSVVIKTVSENQDEILYNILRLYVKKSTFDCDFTYSVGNFYVSLEKPPLKFDINPQSEDVRPLDEALGISPNSLHSVVVDLPFIVNVNNNGKFKSKIAKRFDYFRSEEELYEANDRMIALAHSKLKVGGFLIMKTMDVCGPSRQLWINNYVQNKAAECGFILEDIFILVSQTKYLFTSGLRQRHARKYHSYFFVFRKGKKHK